LAAFFTELKTAVKDTTSRFSRASQPLGFKWDSESLAILLANLPRPGKTPCTDFFSKFVVDDRDIRHFVRKDQCHELLL